LGLEGGVRVGLADLLGIFQLNTKGLLCEFSVLWNKEVLIPVSHRREAGEFKEFEGFTLVRGFATQRVEGSSHHVKAWEILLSAR
jgi:hypothetical protein